MIGLGSRVALCASSLLWSLSCERIFDPAGDCALTYRVPVTFTMNLYRADVLSGTGLESLTLYVFDDAGRLVCSKSASSEALSNPGYAMEFSDDEIAPGTYDIVAWGGLSGSRSFALDKDGAVSSPSDLSVRLLRERENGAAVSSHELDDLYHGIARGVEFPGGYGVKTVSRAVDLTKDNNTIRVVLQHYSGLEMKKDDFSFVVIDDNGHLDYENRLLPDETITYRAWSKHEALVGRPAMEGEVTTRSEEITSISSVMAEIDVARLMADKKARLQVWVRGKEKAVIDLDLVQLLLYAKGEARREITDQDYLDCQDDFTLFFYLDDGYGWYTSNGIWVNSWHVIYQESKM